VEHIALTFFYILMNMISKQIKWKSPLISHSTITNQPNNRPHKTTLQNALGATKIRPSKQGRRNSPRNRSNQNNTKSRGLRRAWGVYSDNILVVMDIWGDIQKYIRSKFSSNPPRKDNPAKLSLSHSRWPSIIALGAGLGNTWDLSLKKLTHQEHKIVTTSAFFDILEDDQIFKIYILPIIPHPRRKPNQTLPHKVALDTGFGKQRRHIAPRKHPKPTKIHIPRHLRKMTRNTQNPKFPLDLHSTPRQPN
jgi:hypothetical protein